MNKEMMLKLLGALPDEALMKSLEMHGIHLQNKGTADDLNGFAPDPTNKVKGWSGINLVTGKDNRPKLADKDYIIKKLALNEGQDMPGGSMGNSGQQYARPF
jgi:hypothetical protein